MNFNKLFVIIFSVLFSTISVLASDTNKIRTIRFEPNPNNMKTSNISIGKPIFIIDTVVENKNTIYRYNPYDLKILLCNAKGKVKKKFLLEGGLTYVDNNEEKISKPYDLETLSTDIVDYKIVPVRNFETKSEPNDKIKNNINEVISMLEMNLAINYFRENFNTNYDNIVKMATKNFTKDVTNDNYIMPNGVTIKFKKYKDNCTYAPDKKSVNYDENACGLVTLDFNGENLPNKYITSEEINDKYKAYLYANTILVETGWDYNYLYKNKYPPYISTVLYNEIKSHYWNQIKKLTIKDTVPAILLTMQNYTNKDVEYAIDIMFYDDNDKYLSKITEQGLLNAHVTGSAGAMFSIKMDFNNIPSEAKYYSLKIVKDSIVNK